MIHLATKLNARMAELVDAPDLGSGDVLRGGSIPSSRTMNDELVVIVVQ